MASFSALMAQRFGAVFGLLGVILGAFGAHFLKPVLVQNDTIDVWHTAVLYQFVHALALLVAGQKPEVSRGLTLAWVIGIILFSGSLYLLALDPTQRWAGPITPLGGLAFIVGWGWLCFDLWKNPRGHS